MDDGKVTRLRSEAVMRPSRTQAVSSKVIAPRPIGDEVVGR